MQRPKPLSAQSQHDKNSTSRQQGRVSRIEYCVDLCFSVIVTAQCVNDDDGLRHSHQLNTLGPGHNFADLLCDNLESWSHLNLIRKLKYFMVRSFNFHKKVSDNTFCNFEATIFLVLHNWAFPVMCIRPHFCKTLRPDCRASAPMISSSVLPPWVFGDVSWVLHYTSHSVNQTPVRVPVPVSSGLIRGKMKKLNVKRLKSALCIPS